MPSHPRPPSPVRPALACPLPQGTDGRTWIWMRRCAMRRGAMPEESGPRTARCRVPTNQPTKAFARASKFRCCSRHARRCSYSMLLTAICKRDVGNGTRGHRRRFQLPLVSEHSEEGGGRAGVGGNRNFLPISLAPRLTLLGHYLTRRSKRMPAPGRMLGHFASPGAASPLLLLR